MAWRSPAASSTNDGSTTPPPGSAPGRAAGRGPAPGPARRRGWPPGAGCSRTRGRSRSAAPPRSACRSPAAPRSARAGSAAGERGWYPRPGHWYRSGRAASLACHLTFWSRTGAVPAPAYLRAWASSPASSRQGAEREVTAALDGAVGREAGSAQCIRYAHSMMKAAADASERFLLVLVLVVAAAGVAAPAPGRALAAGNGIDAALAVLVFATGLSLRLA